MDELFGKFRKDDKKKKFKKNAGLEKPEPEAEEKDPAVEELVERMAGASASAGRAKKRGKRPPFPIRNKEDDEE